MQAVAEGQDGRLCSATYQMIKKRRLQQSMWTVSLKAAPKEYPKYIVFLFGLTSLYNDQNNGSANK
jgi:hypothetical protein